MGYLLQIEIVKLKSICLFLLLEESFHVPTKLKKETICNTNEQQNLYLRREYLKPG